MIGIVRPSAADLLTLGNALCGAAAIVLVATTDAATLSTEHLLQVVAVLLVCATVLDTVDGPVARRWGGSALGAPLDNLADCVTFGVAPAVALSVLVGRDGGGNPALVGGALVYTAGALLRLADFAAVRHEQADFTGLPSPLAATCAIVLGFLSPTAWVAAFALAALGLLMISSVRYPAQRGAALALSSAGWVVWLGGSLGLYPMPAPALAGLVVVLLVVPIAHNVRLQTTALPAQVDP